MNVKTAKYIAIFSAVGLLALMGVFLFVIKKKNQTLESTLAEQKKEITARDIRINDLMSANQTLDALVRQQNKLIEGESLGEFMELYDSDKIASMVEVLVHLEGSESGLPMRFVIKGSSQDCDQHEEEQ